MADKKENKGQEKVHGATRIHPDGSVEAKDFTQTEWKARDKSEGWTRDDGEDVEEPEEPEEPERMGAS